MLKLKLQYVGHLMNQLIRKNPHAGKDRGRKEKGVQRMRRLDSITDSMDMNLSKLRRTEEPGTLQPTGLQRVRYNSATEQHCLPCPKDGR